MSGTNAELIAWGKMLGGRERELADALEAAELTSDEDQMCIRRMEAECDAALAAYSGGAGEMEFGVRVGTRANPTRYATRGMAEYAAAYPVLGNADHPHVVVMRKAMYGPWEEATK